MGTGAIIGICLMLIVRFGFKVSFALPCLSHQETVEDIPVTWSNLIIKPVVLTGGEMIDVASIVYGKMIRPLVEIGTEVKGWEPVLQLQDTQMHYDQQANYEQTRLQIALEARKRLPAMQERIDLLQKQEEKAEQDYFSLQSEWDKLLQADLSSSELSSLSAKLQVAEQVLKTAKFNHAQARSDFFAQKLQNAQQISSASLSYRDALYQYASLTLRAPVSGTVAEILLTGGQDVEKGQLAFRLSQPLQKLEIELWSGDFSQRDQDSSVFLKTRSKNLKTSVLAITPSDILTGAYHLTLELSEPLLPNGEVAQLILRKK